MTLTHKIYNDLRESLSTSDHMILSQPYITTGQLCLIYALNRATEQRSFYFPAEEKEIEGIPQCKGLIISKAMLLEYSRTDYYCQIAQNATDDSDIYEVIIEDIRKNVGCIQDRKKAVGTVSQLLRKWQQFFAKDRSVLLPPERQQGLYGELLFLSQLIELRGVYAVKCWTGCDYETHDFYVDNNAIEVKTTSVKAPYKMHITSEQQLDDSEVPGNLFVDFTALVKSTNIGETLPEMVKGLRDSLVDTPSMQQLFEKKLEAYGYFDGLEDKYTTCYRIREGHTYRIKDGFPRLIPQMLAKGVSKCTYDVLIDDCTSYEVTTYERNTILKGSTTSG